VQLRFCERCQANKDFIDDEEFARLRILLQRAQRNAGRYRRGRKELPEDWHLVFYQPVCEEYARLTGVPENNWINVLHHWDRSLGKTPEEDFAPPP
jgi:hypothetical protein